jgi:uncharacterized protein YndB with AHSA1/START domain
MERTYRAPIQKVWNALTDKEQLKQWYLEVSDFKPEPGFRFELYGQNNGIRFVHRCMVTEASPVTRLSYTWSYADYEGQSLVTFELFEETAATTRLKLTHSGTDTFPLDHPDFKGADFVQGWNGLLGKNLLNFVEMDSLEKSISIQASASAIWDVIMNPNHQWANAFGGGALADTTWETGSPIIWTDLEGNIGANGVVITKEPGSKLELRYYDDLQPAPGAELGSYWERFRIEPQPGGSHTLHVEAGELSRMYTAMHDPMWDEALKMIKEQAEK